MKTKVEKISSCTRLINIEVSPEDLKPKMDQVYVDIGRVARIPGFREGKAPRDLLEAHYSRHAEEELIKRAVPEYCLKAIRQEKLQAVAPSEIENVEFKNQTLYFSARVDVRPQVKLKDYKNLRITKKQVKIEQSQVEQMLEKLRQSKTESEKDKENAQKQDLPELNNEFAKKMGFDTLDKLREAVYQNLQANAEMEAKQDMEYQLFDSLFQRAVLDVPESLVKRQTEELLKQIRFNHVLHGARKEELASKEKQLHEDARKEAVRRVKLTFILNEIAQRENIQADEKDFTERIEAIAQRSAKTTDEVKEYLVREGLIYGLQQEIRDRKTIEFLLGQAKVEEK